MAKKYGKKEKYMENDKKETSEMKKLDKGTFGNSPACFYLVDLINGNPIYLKRMKRLHTKHQKLNQTLNEIVNAYRNKALSLSTARHLITLKQGDCKTNIIVLREFEIHTAETDKEKEDVNLLINVFENVMMMEFKKILRELHYYHLVEIKSIKKASAFAKKMNTPNFGTYVVQGEANDSSFKAEVTLDYRDAPKVVIKSEFIDRINSNYLNVKHSMRMENRQKTTTEKKCE